MRRGWQASFFLYPSLVICDCLRPVRGTHSWNSLQLWSPTFLRGQLASCVKVPSDEAALQWQVLTSDGEGLRGAYVSRGENPRPFHGARGCLTSLTSAETGFSTARAFLPSQPAGQRLLACSVGWRSGSGLCGNAPVAAQGLPASFLPSVRRHFHSAALCEALLEVRVAESYANDVCGSLKARKAVLEKKVFASLYAACLFSSSTLSFSRGR